MSVRARTDPGRMSALADMRMFRHAPAGAGHVSFIHITTL